MGRHSAQAQVRKRRRLSRNALTVAGVTLLVAGLMFGAIAMLASARNDYVPPPYIVEEPSIFDAFTKDDVVVPPVEQVAPGSAMNTGGGVVGAPLPALRTCPATGCQAASCHAETGEPIPGR